MIANRDAKIICEIAALSMCSYFGFRKINMAICERPGTINSGSAWFLIGKMIKGSVSFPPFSDFYFILE